jgi:microcystin-dependent protein
LNKRNKKYWYNINKHKMSLSEKSKRTNAIFGTVKVYKSSVNSWTYLTTPEIGDIKQSVHSSAHNGWLKCDGTAISRSTYADLFAIIGTSFGAGDGTTTFNLPDARGRVLGTTGDGSGLTSRSLGSSVGSETHTLTADEMPVHSHGITDPGHNHSYVNNTNDQNTDNVFASEIAADQVDLSSTTGTSTTGITVNNAGGGLAHNNMQPTLFIGNTFIFAAYRTHTNYPDA